MMATDTPSEPVETVDAVSVLGARIMRGTWSDGQQAVLISPARPTDPVGARLMIDAGELPTN